MTLLCLQWILLNGISGTTFARSSETRFFATSSSEADWE
jgi:hypothetical protein